jgi:uncharacterized membrane protein YwzB
VRAFLNDVPEWALALIFVGGAVAVTLGLLVLVRRYLDHWRDMGSVEGVLGVAAMVMTLYALVLAFVVVNLYSDYDKASTDVSDEANSLGAVVQDARAFPLAARQRVDAAVVRYVTEVRRHEFDRLAKGGHDEMFDSVNRFSPVTPTQSAFYRAAVDQLNVFVGERENRVAKAGTSIPPPLMGLLIFLAIATVLVTLFINTGHRGLDLALVIAVAIVVSAGFVTALILQYPYSGTIAVSSDAFTRGSLTHLVGVTH